MMAWPCGAPDKLFGMDGLLPVAFLLSASSAAIFLFLVGHIYLATTGAKPISMIKMMVTGWREHH